MATKGKLIHRQAFSSTFIAGMHALRMGAIPGRTACCDALGLDSTALQLIILFCNFEGLRHTQKPKYIEYLVKYVQSHIQAGPALMQANCPSARGHRPVCTLGRPRTAHTYQQVKKITSSSQPGRLDIRLSIMVKFLHPLHACI